MEESSTTLRLTLFYEAYSIRFGKERTGVLGIFSPAIRYSPSFQSGATAAVGFRNNGLVT